LPTLIPPDCDPWLDALATEASDHCRWELGHGDYAAGVAPWRTTLHSWRAAVGESTAGALAAAGVDARTKRGFDWGRYLVSDPVNYGLRSSFLAAMRKNLGVNAQRRLGPVHIARLGRLFTDLKASATR
jgi:hypothetical protein